MAINTAEAQLVIRARQIGANTIDATTGSLKKLNQTLLDQTVAAAKGEASSKDLAKTLGDLQAVGEKIIGQTNLFANYDKAAGVLQTAQDKADGLRAKMDALKASQDASGTATKAQADAVSKLQAKITAADAAVARQTGNLEKQGNLLRQIGVDTADFAAGEAKVAQAIQEVGTAIAKAGALLDGYEEKLASLTAAEREASEVSAFKQAAAENEAIIKQADYINALTEAFRAQEAQEKELAAIQAFHDTAAQNEQIIKQAQYVRDLTEALNQAEAAEKNLKAVTAFQQQGLDAQASAAQIEAETGVVQQATTANYNLAQSIKAILDPSGAARQTLAGLEAEIAQVVAAIGTGDKPLRDYNDQISALAAISNATVGQAKLIDNFRTQEAVLVALDGEYQTNLGMVQRRSQAIAQATTVEEGQVEALTMEQRALEASSAAVTAQAAKVKQLEAALTAAGIDVNNLSQSETKLKGVTNDVAAATAKLQAANSRGGGASGSLFGLKPYDIQNLGYQVNDLITQISSGTSVLQAFAQQGGQIAQIPGVLKGLVAFLPEIAALAVGLAVLYVALKRIFDVGTDAREFSGILAGSTEALTYNTAALTANALALRDLGVSNSDATAAIKEFISAGLNPDRLNEFGVAVLNLSRAFGEDLPAAAKTFAAGFSGGYAAIAKLDDQLQFLSSSQRQYIRDQFDAGNADKGRAVAFQAFADRVQKAADASSSDWTKAFHDLSIAFNDLADFYSKLYHFDDIGKAFAYIADGAKNIAHWLANIGGEGDSASAALDKVAGAAPAGSGLVTSGSGPVKVDTDAAVKTGSDIVSATEKQIALAGDLNDEQKVKIAYEKAYNDAITAGSDKINAQRNAILKGEEERHKIAEQRIAEAQQIQSQLKSSAIAAAAADPDNLGAQIAANQATRDQQQEIINKARTQGQTAVNFGGASVDLDKLGAIFDKQKSLADLQSTMNVYQSRQNELVAAYDGLINKALGDYAAHATDAAGATKEIQDAQAKIFPQIQANAAAAIKFGQSLGNNPKAIAFLTSIQTTLQALKDKGSTQILKTFDDDLKKSQDAETISLKNLNDQFNEGQLSGLDAIKQANDKFAELTPKVRDAATAALAFAQGLNAAHPSPELQAQIAKYQGILTSLNDTNSKSTLGKFDIGIVNSDEQKLNQTISDRNSLVDTYNKLVETGALSQTDADVKIKAAYDASAPVIQKQIDDITAMIALLKGQDGADLPLLDALNAKLKLASVETQYVNKDVLELGKTINESIANEAVTAFDSAGEALGNAVAGTESWGDALSDLGRASANFFAGLLKDIAEAIIKMEILSALGISGNGSGSGGFGGAIASALLGGGGAAATSGTDTTAIAAFNSLVPAETGAATAASGGGFWASALSYIADLFHGGGVVGGGSSMSRAVSPALWQNAPRYHTGKPAMGLSSDETAAILQDSEEVLTKDNPRHIKNWAGKGGSSSAAPAIRQVLVLNPDDINKVSASSGGEQVFMTHLVANKSTIRQVLGIKK